MIKGYIVNNSGLPVFAFKTSFNIYQKKKIQAIYDSVYKLQMTLSEFGEFLLEEIPKLEGFELEDFQMPRILTVREKVKTSKKERVIVPTEIPVNPEEWTPSKLANIQYTAEVPGLLKDITSTYVLRYALTLHTKRPKNKRSRLLRLAIERRIEELVKQENSSR